jgi:hypothetical protein
MKYAVEMGPDGTICVPSFIRISSTIQKLMRVGDTQTHRQHGYRISLLLCFPNEESRLK